MSCSLCSIFVGDTYVNIATLKMHLFCYEKLSRCIICDRRCFNSNENKCLLCGSYETFDQYKTIKFKDNKCNKCNLFLIMRKDSLGNGLCPLCDSM